MTVPPQRRRRGVLIAPGSDVRKARKALENNADEVILDLEDAVTATSKDHARDLVCDLLAEVATTTQVAVRINGLGTPWAARDLSACSIITGLSSVVLPKAESADDVRTVEDALDGTDVAIQALIETPRGLRNIAEITAASTRLTSVIIGYADLGAALGRSPAAPPEQWLALQDRVLVAARAAGIDAIDGPYLGIRDDDDFQRWCRWTAGLGFDGKWVIHPSQIGTATAAFTPSEQDTDQARRVLDALGEAERLGNGAAQLDGQMLDEAVAVAARRVLARSGGR